MMTIEEIVVKVQGKIRAYHSFVVEAMREGRPWEEVNAARAELVELLGDIHGENETLGQQAESDFEKKMEREISYPHWSEEQRYALKKALKWFRESQDHLCR